MTRLRFNNRLCPGDIVVLTIAVRALWAHNSNSVATPVVPGTCPNNPGDASIGPCKHAISNMHSYWRPSVYGHWVRAGATNAATASG